MIETALGYLIGVAIVTTLIGFGYLMGSASCSSARRRLRTMDILLGREQLFSPSSPLSGETQRERVCALGDELVEAGWVHKDYVDDPTHFDKSGRYLYWGS